MNYWVCSCGKKVSENLKACPYCKMSRRQEITEASDNTKYMKAAIGLLLLIIVVGAYMFVKKGDTTPDQSRPLYVVQQKQHPQDPAQTTQTTNKVVPPVAIEAVNALKKLQAKTQVGITYKDYSPALAEAKYALNLFIESSQAKDFPELAETLSSAFETFAMAGEVWSAKFSGSSVSSFGRKSDHPAVFAKFPEIDQIVSKGGTGVIIEEKDGGPFLIDGLVSFLFSKGNQEIQKASAMIAR